MKQQLSKLARSAFQLGSTWLKHLLKHLLKQFLFPV
jgi:hypothetical protein